GRPAGLDVLAVDARRAGPLLAGPADADRIADRTAVAEHVIEAPLVRAHHHGAGRNAAISESNDLARLRGCGTECRNDDGRQCGRTSQTHEIPLPISRAPTRDCLD